ncbi:MmgE/PrpD family protein [Sphingomonas sp. HMP9]|uniref:MmgE/PrpD family protein n=1 Tax=Sphingomonas sp. HMP9 TaxID=1517554 RepID=UPI001E5CD0E4|nr:MmgE/PrpD family protein [Sphingomonas sp. HMP9]
MTPPSLATTLAEHLATINLSRASNDARRFAAMAVVDTIGITLAGAAEKATLIARRVLGGEGANGDAMILGTSLRTRVLDAVLINGTAAHAVDYDDMARSMGGHPSVPVVPVVVALGEQLGSTGAQVLEAFIIGYEAECRIGRVVHPHHYEKGWHPTSTLGVFGAAAAAARLLKLDVEKTAIAIAIAASSASGIKANFGTMVKPLHVGQAAHDGLMAALLASEGFTANPGALEHKQGFLQAYDGLDQVHPERMLAERDTLEVEQPETGLKQFPCCGSTHPAILAMIALAEAEAIDPAQVTALHIRMHRMRLPHTDNPDPQSPLGAKFSLQYVTARALIDRHVGLADFEGDAYRQPAIRRLLAVTSIDAFPDKEDGNEFAAHVKVDLDDGRVLTGEAASAMGRGPRDPMSDVEMWRKFSDCAVSVLSPEQTRAAFDSLQRLDSEIPIRDILAPFAITLAAGQTR